MIPTQWLLDVITSGIEHIRYKIDFLKGHTECRCSYTGSERGIISQMVTVEPQITEGRVAHTGSAFLPLTVTAPTDVCLNWALIHGEITSLLKSPPTPPSPPTLQKYPSLLCKRTDWDTKSLETLHILSAPPYSPLAVMLISVTHFSSRIRTGLMD